VVSVEAGRVAGAKYRIRDADATISHACVAAGVAFGIIGAVDLVLLWVPVRLGDPIWEFGTLSRTLDNLPMAVLGIALITIGLVRHPDRNPRWVQVAAVALALGVLLLVATAMLYGLAAVAVVGRTPVEQMDAIGRAIIKNVAELVVYIGAFGWMSAACWQSLESLR
jgi:hypothetical protein